MSSKTYFWQVEYSFENPAEKLWPNVWNVFAQNRKTPWRKYFEKKNLPRSFLLTGKIQFGQTCRKLSCKMAAKGLSNMKSDSTRRNISKKSFRKLFFWTGRLQFWRLCQKRFRIKAKTFKQRVWNSQKLETFFPKKFFSQKGSSGELECRFDNPAGSFSSNGRKSFTQNPKVILKK